MKPSHGSMRKKKTKKQSAKATLAEVLKEMAKPRVAMSARQYRLGFWTELVVKYYVEK
jgi:hypothetical protein